MAVCNMCRGDARESFKSLDATLRLFGFGRLGAESAHKIFQMRDFCLLGLECLILLGDALGAGALKVIVVA